MGTVMKLFSELTDILMVMTRDQGFKLVEDIMSTIQQHKAAAGVTTGGTAPGQQ